MANGDKQYLVPSLLKSAYIACNREEQKYFDDMETPDVDPQKCCRTILAVIKLNNTVSFDPLGQRRSMFNKVRDMVLNMASRRRRRRDRHFHHRPRLTAHVCEVAARHGHTDCMMLARSIGVPWRRPSGTSRSACDWAAINGDLPSLEYAFHNGSRWDTKTCAGAAGDGQLNTLRFLHEHGCEWATDTCAMAAMHGHLDCLQYARENGCPWDSDTCSNAAGHGQLGCLVYAHENNCPWDRRTLVAALVGGHADCFRYAVQNGCPPNQNFDLFEF